MLFRSVVGLRRSPLGQSAPVAGAHDCGPERSLRTSPSSSSSSPSATPSDSLGRIEVARHGGRLPEGLRASRPVALLDLWSGKGIFWTPIVAARAAAIGVGVSASDAGALRAGDERFSNGFARPGRGGGGRRGAKRVARDEPLAPTTNSRGLGGALLADGFVGRVEAIDPQTDEYGAARAPTHRKISTLRRTRESGITARKTPRKPQKAARAAGLRRAPSHHSSHARSGILNRKKLRMPPRPPARPRKGDRRKIFHSQKHAA